MRQHRRPLDPLKARFRCQIHLAFALLLAAGVGLLHLPTRDGNAGMRAADTAGVAIVDEG